MTRDELKAAISNGVDRILSMPGIRLFIHADERRLLLGQQSYWQTAPDAELDRLLGLVPQAREEEAPPPAPKSIEEQLLILDMRQEAMIRLLEEMLDTLARLDPSPFSPRPQQRRDAMTAPSQAGGNAFGSAPPQLAAALAGFDWKSINWLQVLQVIQMILTQFQQMHATAQGAATPAGGMQSAMAGCSKQDCLRAHFETIECVAGCGVDCCNAP
jgi:hypothetical protein